MHPRLERALGWVDSRLDDFRFTNPAQIGNTTFGELKAISELAHAAEVLLRSADKSGIKAGKRWLAHAWDQLDGGDVLADLIEASPQFVLVSIAFLPFHFAQRCHARLLSVASRALGSARLSPLEETLMRPTSAILRLEHTWPAGSDCNSTFIVRAAPASFDVDRAYLFVHECLYASRWGHEPDTLDPALASYVADALESLRDCYTERANADLVAELLLAQHALHLPCAPKASWDVLAQTQSEAGRLSSLTDDGLRLPRLEHPRFDRSCHTTLAAIMAWASCRHERVGG